MGEPNNALLRAETLADILQDRGRLRAQRDALLAACEELVEYLESDERRSAQSALARARDAIAKAKGNPS